MTRAFVFSLLMTVVGCGAAVDEDQLEAVLALEGDVAEGDAFYDGNCLRCHGPGGNGDGVGPELAGNDFSREKIVRNILRGPLSMPSFADEDDQIIADVAAYVDSL